MINEKIQLLAQLISAIEEAVLKLESAGRRGNMENFERAKKEILEFQKQVSEVLKK